MLPLGPVKPEKPLPPEFPGNPFSVSLDGMLAIKPGGPGGPLSPAETKTYRCRLKQSAVDIFTSLVLGWYPCDAAIQKQQSAVTLNRSCILSSSSLYLSIQGTQVHPEIHLFQDLPVVLSFQESLENQGAQAFQENPLILGNLSHLSKETGLK